MPNGKNIFHRGQNKQKPAQKCHKCAIKHIYTSSKVRWAGTEACTSPQMLDPGPDLGGRLFRGWGQDTPGGRSGHEGGRDQPQ